MESILAWGLELVRTVQGIGATQGAASPTLTTFMKVLSFTGTEEFYIIVLPFILWCVDYSAGIRIGLFFSVSAFLNSWLKMIFTQPRPYDLDASVGLDHETTYGLPSGHAQGSLGFWGMLSPLIRKPWGLVLMLAVPLLVGFSRVYLGVHFPTDVLAGWFLAACLLIIYLITGSKIEAFLARQNVRTKVLGAAVIAFAMNWLNMKETGLPGIFFGTAVGAALMFEHVHFSAKPGTPLRKAVRLALGLVISAAIYIGLKMFFPTSGDPNYGLFRFLRYGLLGAWVSLGAPWLFIRLGLAAPDKQDEKPQELNPGS